MPMHSGEQIAPRVLCELRLLQFPALARGLQRGDELAAKDLGQRLDRK